MVVAQDAHCDTEFTTRKLRRQGSCGRATEALHRFVDPNTSGTVADHILPTVVCVARVSAVFRDVDINEDSPLKSIEQS